MSLPNQALNAAGVTVGTSAATYPAWQSAIDQLGGSWPYIVQGGGLVVIVLTVVKLLLEIRKLMRGKGQ
jgi:hypothetical protein